MSRSFGSAVEYRGCSKAAHAGRGAFHDYRAGALSAYAPDRRLPRSDLRNRVARAPKRSTVERASIRIGYGQQDPIVRHRLRTSRFL